MRKINIYNYKADCMGWRTVPEIGTFAPVGMGCFREGWVRAKLDGGEQCLEDDKILDGVGYGATTRVVEKFWGVLYDDTLQPRQIRCRNGHIFVPEVVNGVLRDFCPICGKYGEYLHPVEGADCQEV